MSEEYMQILYRELTINPQQRMKGRGVVRGRSNGVSTYVISKDNDGTEVVHVPLFHALHRMGLQISPSDGSDKWSSNMKFTGSLYQYQKEYANSVVDALNSYRTTGLTLYPGAGKTTMGVAIACQVGMVAVVLVHDKGLISQWKMAFERRSTASVWMVGEGSAPSRADVIVCLYTRTSKIPEVVRRKVGFLLVDEAHEYCNTSGAEAILDFTPHYLLALTATWNKSNEMQKVLELFTGPPVVGALTVPFKFTKIVSSYTALRVRTANGINWSQLIQSLLYNPARNLEIINLVKWLVEVQNRKPIVFTTEVEHVKTIHQLLREGGISSCDWLAENKDNYNDSLVLVGNVQKCGTGFDEEMYCSDWQGRRIDTAVLISSFREPSLLAQVIGRTFRSEDPWIYHIVDNDPTIKGHWRECHNWYLENKGTEVGTIDLNYFA